MERLRNTADLCYSLLILRLIPRTRVLEISSAARNLHAEHANSVMRSTWALSCNFVGLAKLEDMANMLLAKRSARAV